MYIDSNWRILTVGDGDLSFSHALLNRFNPKQLTASVLDSEQVLLAKYGENSLAQLKQAGIDVVTELDITDSNSWQKLDAVYDLIIFQFPLVPGFQSKHEYQAMSAKFGDDFSINTLNRRLLRKFLKAGFEHILAPDGARLAYISSKDVKPYIEWNIEDQISSGLVASYLGSQPFDVRSFTGYRIRNVDRDKHVKETQAATYVWSDKPQPSLALIPFVAKGETGCDICRAGPFTTEQEKLEHQASAKHKRMSDYHRQWRHYLTHINI